MTSSEENAIREKLKAQPRYAMRFVPAIDNLRLSRQQMQSLITENAVRLRGWDLPHENGMQNAQDYIFNAVDWGMHLEFWRFYKSGQFVTSSSLWDIRDDIQSQLRQQFDKSVLAVAAEQKQEIRLVIGFIGTIYSVTEYYLFASRLAKALEIVDFSFTISLHNIENTAIIPGDEAVSWHAFCRAAIDEIRVTTKSHEIIGNPLAASADALRDIFECYQWMNSEGAIKHWQERFMAGRFAF
jgi:hypothetical protein